MVKKPSFFEKIFGGKRETETESRRGTPVRQTDKRGVDSRLDRRGPAATPKPAQRSRIEPAKARQAESSPQRGGPQPTPAAKSAGEAHVQPKPVVEPSVSKKPGEPENGSSRTISRVLGTNKREEAAVALTDGFRDLSQLLQGVNSRMEEQGKRADSLDQKFEKLPAMAEAQIDFMGKIALQMSDQKEKTGELLKRLGGLPDLLEGIHSALERNAAAEHRTEKTLTDFRDTMNQIHSSIGTLTTESQRAVKETAGSFERVQKRSADAFENAQKRSHASFERSQAAHIKKLEEMMEQNGRSTRAITTMLVVVTLALLGLIYAVTQGI